MEGKTIQTIFKQPITELIKIRHSVRNYKEEALPTKLITEIKEYISFIDNPFKKEVQICLIEKSSQIEDMKLGTYGVIKGVRYFLVTSCDKDKISLMALGYSLEKVILFCTSLGLGTVWLGGTFNKSNFSNAINLSKDKVIPIVAPVGYEGGKKSFLGKLLGNHSNQRKEFSDIFFDHSFDMPLVPTEAGEYKEPLEMLRLAPSAVNKQPWRAVKVGEDIHFYLASTKDFNYIDLGIGLCHFDLTMKELGYNGGFSVQENPVRHSNFKYIVSWRKSK